MESDIQERWREGLAEMATRDKYRAPERNAHYDLIANEAFALFALKGSVIDVGCGSGWPRRRLVDCVPYHGVDPAHSGVDLYGEDGLPDSIFHIASGESLPFQSGYFRSALCYSVLQHVEHPDVVLSEIRRVLAPKGRVGILICVESQDPVFLHHWTGTTALQLVAGHFVIKQCLFRPGMYPEDGRHLIVSAAKA